MTTVRKMTSTLLLVEPSETMRFVLQSHLQSLGFPVRALADYAEAEAALVGQFARYDNDIAALLLGWPTLTDKAASALLAHLESSEFPDLPVIVLSTDMRADTRAWVAGREHTAVLPWRDYQQVAPMLERLLEAPDGDGDAFERKFDNRDIHLLVVDDSASIRFTLGDLFRLQGYRVSVAADPEAALAIARDEPVDIALLDFYLQDTTGDILCRRLQQADLAVRPLCAVLTGSYSDHIIKRSLRAGAIECMFKNESSELLLARIDAIGRLVRQRRQLAADSTRLERVIDSVADVLVLVDAEERVLHAGPAAERVFGAGRVAGARGMPLAQLLDVAGIEGLPEWSALAASGVIEVRARLAENADTPLQLLHDALDGVGRLWRVRDARSAVVADAADTVDAADAADTADSQDTADTPGTETRTSDVVPATATVDLADTPFEQQLQRYLEAGEEGTAGVSLLLLDVVARHVGENATERRPTQEFDDVNVAVLEGLRRLYRREHHVAHLDANRFGVLLRHASADQSYALTRKVMQLLDGLELDPPMVLNTTGCLLGLGNTPPSRYRDLLARAGQGLDIVNGRGVDQALLLDIRKILPVWS